MDPGAVGPVGGPHGGGPIQEGAKPQKNILDRLVAMLLASLGLDSQSIAAVSKILKVNVTFRNWGDSILLMLEGKKMPTDAQWDKFGDNWQAMLKFMKNPANQKAHPRVWHFLKAVLGDPKIRAGLQNVWNKAAAFNKDPKSKAAKKALETALTDFRKLGDSKSKDYDPNFPNVATTTKNYTTEQAGIVMMLQQRADLLVSNIKTITQLTSKEIKEVQQVQSNININTLS